MPAKGRGKKHMEMVSALKVGHKMGRRANALIV
ncbi:hypothetical protein FHU14_001770 [Mesorhizobium sp. RMAD-H1]|nr:hypothetical protein [Mesorhizobium sp. RMAD-H1]